MAARANEIFLKSSDKRPEELEALVRESFEKISQSSPPWTYNGAKKYKIYGIDDDKLVNCILRKITKKNAYLLDIGAGNFSWGKSIASMLHESKELPPELTIHIISVTGERYDVPEKEKVGQCILYNFSAFEIENLDEALKKRGLELEGKEAFNLIVSRYCFVHLHDPIRLFMKAYNMLDPENGYMLIDGFPIFFSNPELSETRNRLYEYKRYFDFESETLIASNKQFPTLKATS